MDERLTLSKDEVKEILHCEDVTLHKLKRAGKLTPCKHLGKNIYRTADVLAFLEVDEECSPYAYRQLQREVERLKDENRRLKAKLFKVQTVISVEVNEIIPTLTI